MDTLTRRLKSAGLVGFPEVRCGVWMGAAEVLTIWLLPEILNVKPTSCE